MPGVREQPIHHMYQYCAHICILWLDKQILIIMCIVCFDYDKSAFVLIQTHTHTHTHSFTHSPAVRDLSTNI